MEEVSASHVHRNTVSLSVAEVKLALLLTRRCMISSQLQPEQAGATVPTADTAMSVATMDSCS